MRLLGEWQWYSVQTDGALMAAKYAMPRGQGGSQQKVLQKRRGEKSHGHGQQAPSAFEKGS